MLQPKEMVETREDALAVLKEGKVDLKEFDRVSEKTLEQLFKEVDEQEVRLRLIKAKDGAPAYVARVALTVAITVKVPLRVKYLEVARKLASGRIIRQRRDWTITGTRRRGVPIEDDTLRELEEELDLAVKPAQLDYGDQKTLEPYQSSAYPLLKTHAHVQFVDCFLDDLPWIQERKIITDGWKTLTIRRFPLDGLA